jgi:hypothetical protein
MTDKDLKELEDMVDAAIESSRAFRWKYLKAD